MPILRPIPRVKFQVELMPGDVIALVESHYQVVAWEVAEKHTLIVEGTHINEGSVNDYMVSSEAITIPKDAVQLTGSDLFTLSTHTDIGGHYLVVTEGPQGGTIFKTHLSNGFGDGSYRLKFCKGQLVR